jgi:5-formyltetrahydrofolate cyclo-ligase
VTGEKQAIRERVWDDLADSDIARFPFPPHDRIPNVADADAAADRLADTDAWRRADAIKSNPDAPQLPVRRGALRDGKTLYVAVPRLREERCFLELDPDTLGADDVDDATTVSGISTYGDPVRPEGVEALDLVVAGSVAVDERGSRVGKGEGYSDLEWGLLSEFDRVDETTTVVTTVHERQVLDESLPRDAHDVPMDLIVTSERVIETDVDAGERPSGIDWDHLDDSRLAEIPVLSRLEDS